MNLDLLGMIECSSEVNKYKKLGSKKEGKLILHAFRQDEHASDMKWIKNKSPAKWFGVFSKS